VEVKEAVMIVALHAPDGFLKPSVAAVAAVAAGAVLAMALRASSRELGDRQIPLAGVSAAFIFAAQMFNFPVASGTTGHLLGGALAAILLGPWVGSLVVAVVVVVQALMFADGGLTALGYNTLNMAIVPAFGGWALFRLFRRLLPNDSSGVVGASGLAAGASVVLAAVSFSLQWLFGASAPVPFDTVFGAMVGVHTLIGIGEGVITGLVVAAVLASRPDLVVGAADLAPTQPAGRQRVGARTFLIGGVLAAIFMAAVVSQFAASSPDGLERVAEEQGFADSAEDHAFSNGLFADYATRGIDNDQLSLAVAGSAGVALTLVVGWGLAFAPRRLRASPPAPS
jgi:cobalt/nickel transport system permease protein